MCVRQVRTAQSGKGSPSRARGQASTASNQAQLTAHPGSAVELWEPGDPKKLRPLNPGSLEEHPMRGLGSRPVHPALRGVPTRRGCWTGLPRMGVGGRSLFRRRLDTESKAVERSLTPPLASCPAASLDPTPDISFQPSSNQERKHPRVRGCRPDRAGCEGLCMQRSSGRRGPAQRLVHTLFSFTQQNRAFASGSRSGTAALPLPGSWTAGFSERVCLLAAQVRVPG